jgi:hypothetical protein
VISRFEGDDFTMAGRLDAEFLLGYHCQTRRARTSRRLVPSQEGELMIPRNMKPSGNRRALYFRRL